jgi:LEA14-like dessication related protein
MAAGCSRFRDVALENIAVSQFNMTSLSSARIKISATLNNPTGGRIRLTQMNGALRLKDKQIALFSMDSALVFDARSTSTNEGVVSMKISDMSVLFSGTIDLDETLLQQIRLDIDATVKSGGIKRTLHLSDIPAKELLEL